MSRLIYADHAAATPLSRGALAAMLPFLTGRCGTPGSACARGAELKRALEQARAQTASAVGALPEEIFFTSGGTESDNWAIRSAVQLRAGHGKHIITSAIEHHAVLHTLRALEQEGFAVTYLGVDGPGRVSPGALRAALRSDTVLITVMTANNEIGTLQPVAELGQIAREAGVLFHTDAVQAAGHIPLDVTALNADLLSLSGHKFGGPRGVGALWVRRGIRLPPLLLGGRQEGGLRPGSENIAGIVGLGAALEEAVRCLPEETRRLSGLRDRLIRGVLESIPGARLTGDPLNRLPGLASFVFDGVEGEPLILLLDQRGICASAGSACSAGALEPSHVLLAAGLSRSAAFGSLRLSLGACSTGEDVKAILDVLPGVVGRIRAITGTAAPS